MIMRIRRKRDATDAEFRCRVLKMKESPGARQLAVFSVKSLSRIDLSEFI